MVTRKRGRPVFCLALPQEVIDLLKERGRDAYGPGGQGTSGGASRLVRTWIYEKLDLDAPAEWGERNPAHAAYQRARRASLAAQKATTEAADQAQDATP